MERVAEMAESEPRQVAVKPWAAVTIAVLIAATAGLAIGNAAKPSDIDSTAVQQQALVNAREDTTAEVRSETARTGFMAGRKLGTRQGRTSGVAAGRADGRISAQAIAVRRAQSEASRAQASLDAISEPPPTPSP